MSLIVRPVGAHTNDGAASARRPLEAAAVADVLDRRGRELFGLCRRLGLDEEESNDAVQEAFLRMWAESTKGTVILDAEAWAFRVTYRLAMDHHRLGRLVRALTDRLSDVAPREELDPRRPDRGMGGRGQAAASPACGHLSALSGRPVVRADRDDRRDNREWRWKRRERGRGRPPETVRRRGGAPMTAPAHRAGAFASRWTAGRKRLPPAIARRVAVDSERRRARRDRASIASAPSARGIGRELGSSWQYPRCCAGRGCRRGPRRVREPSRPIPAPPEPASSALPAIARSRP